MPDELLFTVVGSTAQPAQPIPLADAGLKERADLQEWVLAHPIILGSDVKIVTFEFDRWWTTSGTAPADRLDVLGLGEDGRLVVAELKRDMAPDTTEMQAIKYAAMASRFTLDSLAEQHARFREQRQDACSKDEALSSLATHAPDLSEDTLRRPRIVLLAREFPSVVTATTVWLTEMGLDITLLKFQAYRSTAASPAGREQHTQVLLSVTRIYPVRDVEEFTVSPAQAQIRAAAETTRRTRDVSTVRRLIESGTISDGTVLTVNPRDINTEAREKVEAWLGEKPKRSQAVWQNKTNAPLRWHADDEEYTPSGLARMIVREAAQLERQFYGTQWWCDPEGRTLVELAAALSGSRAASYQAFWTRFLERVTAEHPNWTAAKVPPDQNWIELSSGIKGTHYSHVFARDNQLRTELYIDTGDEASTSELYNNFLASRDRIESTYGAQLDWQPLPGKRACRIADHRPDADVGRIDEHEAYIDWFFDTGTRLREALGSGTAT